MWLVRQAVVSAASEATLKRIQGLPRGSVASEADLTRATAGADAARARVAQAAATLGVAMEVLPQALSHRQLNRELGLPSDYTAAVDRWLDALAR